MNRILSGILVSAFLISGLALAQTTEQKTYPIVDVSKLENFKVELTDKQKQKIDKAVDKTNRDIEKVVNKMDKTRSKIEKMSNDASKETDKQLEKLQELNTQLTAYKVEIVRITKEHKDKVSDILNDKQKNDLKTYMNNGEEIK